MLDSVEHAWYSILTNKSSLYIVLFYEYMHYGMLIMLASIDLGSERRIRHSMLWQGIPVGLVGRSLSINSYSKNTLMKHIYK